MGFIVVALFLGLIVFWVREFVQLMLLADSDFPGRFDKPLWVGIFVCTLILAPIVFVFWKQNYLSMREIERKTGGPTLSS